MMKTTGKTGRDAGGTFREPTLVFMVAACWTEKVDSWAKQQLSIMVEAKMGRILVTIFTSSTCSILHWSPCQMGLLVTALLRIVRLLVSVWLGCIEASRFSSLLLVGLLGLVSMLMMAVLGPAEQIAAMRTCDIQP